MDATRLVASEATNPKSSRNLLRGILHRLINPGIRFKLLFLVVSVSLIIVALSSFLLFNFQRQQIIDNTRSATMVLSNTIEAGLRHAMLGNERLMIDEIVQAVAAEDIVDTVRILDAQGIIRVSSVPAEIGTSIEQTDPACQSCDADSIPKGGPLSVVTSSKGRQALLDINIIQNQSACHACHNSEDEVLGLLIVETSLANLSDQLSAGVWRTAGVAVAIFTLLIGLALLLLTAIGHALALRQPKIRLPSKAKGPRLSLLSVGRLFFLSFLQNHKLSTRFLIQNIPKPTLRSFEWIDTQTKKETQK